MPLITAEEIQRKLREIRNISTLPQVMNRIMAVVIDPDSSAKDLAAEIRQDQALASKILKIANSAYYGFYRKVASVDDAVVLLGFREIRSMCLAIAVVNMFDEKRNPFFDRRAFWRHCFVTAQLSEILAEDVYGTENLAFTAGLLHDLGRAALDQYFPEIWKTVCMRVDAQQVHWLVAERELMEIDHTEVGALLAQRWDFPESLIQAIRYHHEPSSAKGDLKLVAVVHLANILSRKDLDPPPAVEQIPPLDSNAYGTLDLSKDSIEKAMKKWENRSDGLQELIDTLVPK